MLSLNTDQMSGIDRPEQVIARTADQFQSLWQRHAPGRPAPSVNFASQMVLAVFLGSRPSGGYEVAITEVRAEAGALVVRWTERRPAPGQMAAQVLTAPSHFVTVPRHTGEVRFERVDP